MTTTPAQNFYHLGFSEDLLSSYKCKSCLLTGDPERARYIGEKFLKKSQLISDKRGLVSYLGFMENGESFLVATSGMGASSTSIVLNELAQAGIKSVIRLGTTGSIQDYIPVGSLIVSKASLCSQGAANDIAPADYPASADPFLTVKLYNYLQKENLKVFCGITASVDTFYEGQERYYGKNKYLMRKNVGLIEEYRHLNVLNFEMESGVLFKSANVYGMNAACVCMVVANRTMTEEVTAESLENTIQICTRAIMNTVMCEVSGHSLQN